jgi:hypothetical protein
LKNSARGAGIFAGRFGFLKSAYLDRIFTGPTLVSGHGIEIQWIISNIKKE